MKKIHTDICLKIDRVLKALNKELQKKGKEIIENKKNDWFTALQRFFKK